MKSLLLMVSLTILFYYAHCQFEPWSDPELLTDTVSMNSNPELLVFETSSYLFYEKKFSADGPVKIYYRDIKNQGPEIELLGETDYDFRNPVLKWDYYPSPAYFLFFESNMEGNFNTYALRFDEFLNFGDITQLTFTPTDENNTDFGYWNNDICWDNEGKILSAKLVYTADTVYLDNLQTIDEEGCYQPELCESRLIFLKITSGATAIYASDWNYMQGQWGPPVVLDPSGYNSYCHCSADAWWYVYSNCLVYEKEGLIFNYFYDEFHELILPAYYGETYEPHSVLYNIPVDNIPAPLFITFRSGVTGFEDIYVLYTEFGNTEVTNVSVDDAVNSRPQLFYGWYAGNPCSMYILNIWETQQNGFQPLYMSKTPVYVCGSVDDEAAPESRLKVGPNPFSNTLTVRYDMPEKGLFALDILAGTGQLLQHAEVDADGPGWKEFHFTPDKDLPPGILYIRLTQGNKQLFRKVIYK